MSVDNRANVSSLVATVQTLAASLSASSKKPVPFLLLHNAATDKERTLMNCTRNELFLKYQIHLYPVEVAGDGTCSLNVASTELLRGLPLIALYFARTPPGLKDAMKSRLQTNLSTLASNLQTFLDMQNTSENTEILASIPLKLTAFLDSLPPQYKFILAEIVMRKPNCEYGDPVSAKMWQETKQRLTDPSNWNAVVHVTIAVLESVTTDDDVFNQLFNNSRVIGQCADATASKPGHCDASLSFDLLYNASCVDTVNSSYGADHIGTETGQLLPYFSSKVTCSDGDSEDNRSTEPSSNDDPLLFKFLAKLKFVEFAPAADALVMHRLLQSRPEGLAKCIVVQSINQRKTFHGAAMTEQSLRAFPLLQFVSTDFIDATVFLEGNEIALTPTFAHIESAINNPFTCCGGIRAVQRSLYVAPETKEGKTTLSKSSPDSPILVKCSLINVIMVALYGACTLTQSTEYSNQVILTATIFKDYTGPDSETLKTMAKDDSVMRALVSMYFPPAYKLPPLSKKSLANLAAYMEEGKSCDLTEHSFAPLKTYDDFAATEFKTLLTSSGALVQTTEASTESTDGVVITPVDSADASQAK